MWLIDYCVDYLDREIADDILAALDDFEDWELETIIAAEAAYAENFLSMN
jgi:hypothetical protein